MEVQAEATLHLNSFQDEKKAREIVKSSGLTLTELGGGRVQVRGYYSRLKTASARLKELLEAPTKPTQHFSWSDEKASSPSDSRRPGPLYRSKSLPKQKSPRSPLSRTVFSQSWDRQTSLQNSFRPGSESFHIDADLFKYADRLKNEEIQNILRTYSVQLYPKEYSDSFILTLKGADSNKAAFNLKQFFINLNDSLRTQDVPMKEMGHDGTALWKQIKKSGNIYNSVLVCKNKDSLHLVGPSEESYMLKQKLLNGQTPLTKRGSFRWKKLTIHSKNSKRKVKEGAVDYDDPPVGGAVGGDPVRTHDLSRQQGSGGFFQLGSKRKKENPDRTHRHQKETETPPSKSSISKFLSWFSKKSNKPKNKKEEK
ncbi:RNA-binding protein 43 [Gouania willdenowi]|uniref:RNA-binding protein 43 n=1 Tax=Gouania willdenowi TaxID=441366 RepID=UPI001054E8E6|nr:uncharacterized protein LOC114472263 [Gouania willdenowi]